MRPVAGDRILVELHQVTSQRQRRELEAFVRFCVFRLEREFGPLRWLVRITPNRDGFTCFVAVTIANMIVESRGRGFDGVCAAWDALTNAEQGLRDARGERRSNEPDHLAPWDVAVGS
jgi:hypothetical protein